MKNILTIVLLTMVSAGFVIAQNGADAQELIRLDKEWSAAMERGDRDVLNRIIADDYTTRNGTWNKTQYIEQAMKDKADDDLNLKNASSVSSNYSVKFKSADMAVMTHITIGKGDYKGKAFTNYSRSIHIWMKRGGRWQVVANGGNAIPDENVLRHIEREWEEATKNKDKAWFERNLADEYTATNGLGKRFNKTEDIADTLSNTDTITSSELSNMQVRVHGDMGVVTGRLHRVGKDKNGAFDRNYMFTDTFVKRDGRWQVVSTQATIVVPVTTAKN
ncbi:MAG: nuclear transport factor 2 family protein [Pyrinomonadaceae bacterium]